MNKPAIKKSSVKPTVKKASKKKISEKLILILQSYLTRKKSTQEKLEEIEKAINLQKEFLDKKYLDKLSKLQDDIIQLVKEYNTTAELAFIDGRMVLALETERSTEFLINENDDDSWYSSSRKC
jgi:hypothetical protein